MTITPDQAQKLLDSGTPGPWHKCRDNHSDCDCSEDTVFGPDVIGSENPGIWWTTADETVILSAPDMAQTIAGMTEEWGVERDRPGTAYIDGTVARWITWIGDEARARKACVISPRGGNPRLVRRLVGPVEVIDGE